MSEQRGKVNWWVLALGLAFSLPLVWVLASGFGKDPHALPENSLGGKPAPLFTLNSLDGEAVSLADLKGTPVVINFWASWCGSCVGEHPNMIKAATLYQGKVIFLGITHDDERANALRWLQRHGTGYPNLWDPGHLVGVDYGLTGVPETFFIDREGLIADKVAYAMSFPEIVQRVEGML